MEKKDKTLNVPNLRFPEFSGEWEKTSIGECFSKVENGLTYDTDNTSGVPVTRIETISDKSINYDRVGYANIDDKISKYEMQYGDVLFSHINSLKHIGKTAFYDAAQPLYHGMNLLLLRAKKSLDSKFLYYTLNTHKFLHRCQVLANQAVNQASINTKELKSINISVPQIQEQQKISGLISLLDERIETQKKIIEDLKKLKDAISISLFKSLCEKEYTIGDLCKSISAKRHIVQDITTNGSYPIIQQGENPIAGYTEAIPFIDYKKVILFGDHTLSIYRPKAPFLTSTDGIKILKPTDMVTRDYFYYLLYAFMPEPEGYKRHYSIVKKISVPVPNSNTQKSIVDKLLSIDSKVEIEARILELQLQQKQYLLSQMFI